MKFLTFLSFFVVAFRVKCQNSFLPPDFEDIINSVLNQIPALDVQSECVSVFTESPLNILTLIDATGKLSLGTSSGNFYNLGEFDLCYGKTVVINETEVPKKYCLSTIPLGEVLYNILNKTNGQVPDILDKRMLGSDQDSVGYYFAYCVPSTCSAEDLQRISNAIFMYMTMTYNISTNTKPMFSEKLCYSKASDAPLTAGAITTIVLISVVFFLVLLSTAYDFYLVYFDRKIENDVLLAFSVISNGKKLISHTTNPDQLTCIHGIRAISMAWVVVGHTYSNLFSGPIHNVFDMYSIIMAKPMWLMSAPLAVDTFFTVGGLVTVYTFLKANFKGSKFNILWFYCHRYLRLTPAVAIMILIHYNLLNYLGNGPLWLNVSSILMKPCKDNWWSGLLYLQNFINSPNICVPQTWYLSIDFQLFILSPIVLYPLVKYPKMAYRLLGVLSVLGIIIPTVISYVFELPGFLGTTTPATGLNSAQDFMKYYYFPTYSRFGPYVIGMIYGVIIFRIKNYNLVPKRTEKNILIATCIWVGTIGGLFACLFSGEDLIFAPEYNPIIVAFYNGLNRNVWSIFIGKVVLLCASGFGGYINDFLSTSPFQFMSKLSYCMYLVHFSFITMQYASARVPYYVMHLSVLHQFWGHFVYSLVLALILCLFFESPFIVLERTLLKKIGKKTVKGRQTEPVILNYKSFSYE